ncbi:hypothetical protein GBAR_LOCUS22599 [Geodia barretti]|uniref:Glycosyl hydrolase n=1 Tax=Geodia barretti TaxID=519541 RepID=A0AA35T330_GEOBA|nr:hypothetical protein GBAR_LOCUS22599 [Geodia barretti]
MLRYDHSNEQVRVVTVWPDLTGLTVPSRKYRFEWDSPIAFSPHDPNVLYSAANVVFRSVDDGSSWEVISPDLTRDDVSDREDFDPDTNIAPFERCAISRFAESPVQQGVFWTGSSDGLIHVSRDGGATWADVTPDGLPEWTPIYGLEASPHDAGTAYVAAARYQHGDYMPYLFRTSDYGATWTAISEGIPEGDYTRVIREDPEREGLLYAGTEGGFTSRSTMGTRGTRSSSTPCRGTGQACRLCRYMTCVEPEGEATLTFITDEGEVVRHLSSRTGSPRVPTQQGMNRFVWDMKHEGARRVEGESGAGRPMYVPIVPPGTYRVRLQIGEEAWEERFDVLADPRVSISPEDLGRQHDLLIAIRDKVSESSDAVETARSTVGQIEQWTERSTGATGREVVTEAAEGLREKLSAIEDELLMGSVSSDTPMRGAFYARGLRSRLASLGDTVGMADGAPTRQSYEVFEDLRSQIDSQL